MKQHNGTTYENVWGVTFGDRLEEMKEEVREEERKRSQSETICRMIRLGFDDKTIQAAVGVADVNEIKKLRKMIMN